MMLRSSSTPILGSLLSSYSESPNHNHHSEFNSPKHVTRKLSFHQTGPLNLITTSSYTFNSSPSINAEFTPDDCRRNGFRRAQSEGNLEGLLTASCNGFDESNNSIPTKKFPRKTNCPVLETIPSFSVHSRRRYQDDDEDEDDEDEDDEEEGIYEVEQREVKSEAYMKNNGWASINLVEIENDSIPSKMHLAKGLGAITGGFNGGGQGGTGGNSNYKPIGFGGNGGDGATMEEYYQRMMEENPGNPLFLRNYAQFLHQSKDLGRAEEYYSRAILADPGDGEILSQYAQLTWQLHRNEERASGYFQRAVQAAPEDSHVLAAYAGFLWETEEEEAHSDMLCSTLPLHHESTLAAAKT